MPVATSENGAAVFLAEGSAEWKAHTAQHGPMLAHSTVNGRKGRWIRALEFNPLQHSEEKYAPAPNPPSQAPVPDEAAKARVTAVQRTIQALNAKNRAAFERPKPADPDTVHGATAEETERLTAQAKLNRWQANPPAAPKIGQRS